MIEYEIERRKIKNVYICIKNGKIVVKAPIRISKSKIDELVTQKREWIERKIKNNLKGIFVKELLQKIEENPEEKEVYLKAIEIGLEAM